MPFIDLSGHNIFYEKHGHGDCALLMLPGSIGSTRLEYEKQFQFFDPSKFTLVSWDAPGFGQSRPPERDYNDCYNRDAKLLLQLMDHFNIDKFNLLGFSDGARTAITIASDYPERVLKLILVGATTFNSPKERKVFKLCRSIQGWTNDRRKMYEEVYEDDLQKMWSAWVDENEKLDDFLTPNLARIQCKTLLIYGENDIIAPIDPHARHLKKNIGNGTGNCRIYIFPKTSHYCHQDRPHEFNRIIEKFMADT